MPLTKEQIQQRREKVIAWLASDSMKEYRRDFRNGNGFSVSERSRVAVGSQTLAITEYLRREGFQDNMAIGEYRVRLNQATEQFPENFSFFLMSPVKDVPHFSSNGNRQNEIVAWLRSDGMKNTVRSFRDNRGFSVNERVRVNAYGDVVPITKFLKDEGIVDGAVVSEFRVKVNPANEQYPENISFFLMTPVVSVPQF